MIAHSSLCHQRTLKYVDRSVRRVECSTCTVPPPENAPHAARRQRRLDRDTNAAVNILLVFTHGLDTEGKGSLQFQDTGVREQRAQHALLW